MMISRKRKKRKKKRKKENGRSRMIHSAAAEKQSNGEIAMASQNKLRKSNQAPVVITVFFLVCVVIGFILYASYAYLGYITVNKITSPEINDVMAAMNTLFTPASLVLPLDEETVKAVLVMQYKDIWWIYLAIIAVVFLYITSQNNDDFKNMECGSAKWADKEDQKLFSDKTGIPCAKDFYITVNNKGNKYYATNNLNETVIGGSGAGKSFLKIKPDIMQMTGSYVVTDPSGELYRDTANFLRKNGYKVKVLNLNNIHLTNTYNPFTYVKDLPDLLKLADMFMKNSAGDGEKADFWTGAAQDLFVMILVYLYKSEDEIKSFGRALWLINSISYTDKGFFDEECELGQCITEYLKKPENKYDLTIKTKWNSIKGAPKDTLMSIVITMSTKLRLWSVDDIDMLTQEDEMEFDDVGVHKTAIFLIVPSADTTYKAIANMFYSQMFSRLMYIAETQFKDNRLPLLVSFELDEFANIGTIPDFRAMLSVIRKYNIRICMVYQSLSQLKALYEKEWSDIFGNCSIITVLGTTDPETCEEISKKIGETTVIVRNKTYNHGQQGGNSESETKQARRLLKADEIPKALGKKHDGKCIIFAGTSNPFYLDKYKTQKHPRYKEIGGRGKNSANNADIVKDYTLINQQRKEKYTTERINSHRVSDKVETGDYAEPLTTEQKQEIEVQKIIKEHFEKTDMTNVITYNSDDIEIIEEVNENG